MNSFSLSKLLTAVVMVFFGGKVWGQQAQFDPRNFVTGSDAYAKQEIYKVNGQMPSECREEARKALNAPPASQVSISEECKRAIKRLESKVDSEPCKNAMKEYDKSRRAFNSACGKAPILNAVLKIGGIPDENTEGGKNASNCIRNVVRCQQCAGSGSAQIGEQKLSCGSFSESDSEDDSQSSRLNSTMSTISGLMNGNAAAASGLLSRGGSTTVNQRQLREEMGACLPRSLDELNNLKSAVKDSRQEMKNFEGDLSEKSQKLAKAQAAMKKAQNDATDAQEALNSSAQGQYEKLTNQLDDTSKQAAQEFAKAQMTAENEISQLEMQKIQAHNVYIETKANLERGCHASALKAADDTRKAIIESIKQGTYTKGGFNETLAQGGSSSRAKLQKVAAEAFTACQSDAAFKSVMDSADRAKSYTITTAATEIEKRRKAISTAKAELLKFQNSQNERSMKEINRVNTEYTRKLNGVRRQVEEKSFESQADLTTVAADLSRLNRNLEESKMEYDIQNTRMRLLREMAGGKNAGKEGSVDEAIAAFEQITETDGPAVIAQCCDKDFGQEAKTHCDSVRMFLNGYSDKKDGQPFSPAGLAP